MNNVYKSSENSNRFYESMLRDGPSEQLQVGGRGFPFYEFFRPLHEYFLGLFVVQEFLSFNFPLPKYFFCT